MPDNISEAELKDRLGLIEQMIAEGRRKTENWGWAFVLWGIAYYIATAWSTLGHFTWAWPITVVAAVIVMVVVGSMNHASHAGTTLGRAVGSIWLALGISAFLVFMALGTSGRLADFHLFVAVLAALLGMANGASALVLRWRVQLACAIVWWAMSVAACLGSGKQTMIAFLVAIFLCQIVFGIYGMISSGQQSKRSHPVHA